MNKRTEDIKIVCQPGYPCICKADRCLVYEKSMNKEFSQDIEKKQYCKKCNGWFQVNEEGFCKRCRKTLISQVLPQDKEGWEEKLNELFFEILSVRDPIYGAENKAWRNKLKFLFSEALSQQKADWIEKIERLKNSQEFQKIVSEYSDSLDERICFDDGFHEALQEVIQLLQQDKE